MAQSEISTIIERMRSATAQLDHEASVAADVDAEMSALDVEGPARTLLLAPLQAWVSMHGIVEEHIDQLADLLAELDDATQQVAAAAPEEKDRRVDKQQSLSRRVAQKVTSVSAIMEVPRQLIDDWLTETSTGQIGPLVDRVREAHVSATRALAELSSLSGALQR